MTYPRLDRKCARYLRHSWVALLLVFLPIPSALAKDCRPGDLKFVTGRSGGFYLRVGEAIQGIAEKSDLGICAEKVDQTMHNAAALQSGEAAFGLVQSDVAHDAWYGHQGFGDPFTDMHLVLPLYVESLHILLRPHLTISRVAELKGKRLWLGPEGTGTEYTAKRVLSAAGLNPDKDIEIIKIPKAISGQKSQVEEAGEKLKRMNLDAVFYVTAVPSPQIEDVLGLQSGKPTSEIRLFSLDCELAQRLAADGSYIPTLMPRHAYGQDQSILTVGIQALLLAGKSAPAKDVVKLEQIVRAHRTDIEESVRRGIREDPSHAGHDHPGLSLALLNTPVNPALYWFISQDPQENRIKSDLQYNWWRDSIKPFVPMVLVLVIPLFAIAVWQQRRLRQAFAAQPNVFLLLAGTLLVWCIASGVLYHYEWSVNELFNSFPRSLRSAFCFLMSVPGYAPLTPKGQEAADIIKWLSIVLLGGFATPLLQQAWHWGEGKLLPTTPLTEDGLAALCAPTRTLITHSQNSAILDLTKIGLTSDVLILAINRPECDFDTCPAALKQLKSPAVPKTVRLAMLRCLDGRFVLAEVPKVRG